MSMDVSVNETNEVLGKSSRWIFNWGASILFCLIIFSAFTIPYRGSVLCKAEFHTQHKIVPVLSPYNGIIKKDIFNINNAIEPNSFLFTIFDLSAQKDIPVYAKESGYYMPYKIQFRSKTYVSKNDTLFYIMPDIKSKGEVYCTAAVDEFEISKLSIGNKVLISVAQQGKELTVSGTISSISSIPDQSGKYPFQISLENKDIRSLSENGPFYFNQQAMAQVNYKTQKLAYKLFSLL